MNQSHSVTMLTSPTFAALKVCTDVLEQVHEGAADRPADVAVGLDFRFSPKPCTFDELTQQFTVTPISGACQHYRDLEAEKRAMCSLLLDRAEAVGFLVMRKDGADQNSTAILDAAYVREDLADDEALAIDLGSLAIVEARYLAKQMGAGGVRIPAAISEGKATGTTFYEAFQ